MTRLESRLRLSAFERGPIGEVIYRSEEVLYSSRYICLRRLSRVGSEQDVERIFAVESEKGIVINHGGRKRRRGHG